MASENETVADIVAELRNDANAVMDDQHDEDCWNSIEVSEIYRCLATRIEAAYRREVVARLRNVTIRSDNSRVIVELQRRLKVAEDALKELRKICMATEYIYGRIICDNALAEIHKEGGAE